jgi:arabinose-5-phosphate isomerase
MHPGEAYHGDLGMVHPDDVFLAISNSGETEEVIRLLPFLKDNKNTVVSLTGNVSSTLAINADFHLDIGVEKEACPLQLAPTSSTTNTLAMGDALAVALMTARDFQPENFARFHPGGSLGRRLLTRVRNVMAKDDLPLASSSSSMLEVVQIMTSGRKGVAVIKDNDVLQGVVTDGDIRRAMETFGADFMLKTASDVLTKNPKFIDADARLEEAKDVMNESNITALLVTDKEQFVGIIQLFDCAI